MNRYYSSKKVNYINASTVKESSTNKHLRNMSLSAVTCLEKSVQSLTARCKELETLILCSSCLMVLCLNRSNKVGTKEASTIKACIVNLLAILLGSIPLTE